MKPLLVLVGILCAVGAGAAGSLLVSPTPANSSSGLEPRAAVSPSAPTISVEVQRKMDELNMQIAALEAKVADLQRAETRVAGSDDSVALAAAPTEVAVVQREAILKVIAEDRLLQAQKAEEERKKRDQDALEAKAERVANKLNLNSLQKNQLVDLFGQESTKMAALRDQFQGGAGADGFTNARDSFREIRDWKTGELTKLFGAEIGAQIGEMDGGGRGGFAGGPGGGGGGGNGGNGTGGTNNRRANRNGQGG